MSKLAVTKAWIRNPSDEVAAQEGCYFSEAHGNRVIDFLRRFCRQSQGEWGGVPLDPLPWQRDYLMRLYGWLRPDGYRRFSSAYLEIGKKNGKSTLLSGAGIQHIIAGGEPAAEAYICACDRAQAGIIYGEADRMVIQSPELKGRIESIRSQKRLFCRKTQSKLEALSADVPSKDGLNASLVLFDELHRQPDSKMYQIMKYAGAARRQPLHWDITTAGEDEKGIWHERRVLTEQVNSGEVINTTHFGVVYRADPSDDYEDPRTWRKANPSLGIILSEDKFRKELEEAKNLSPLDWVNFLRLRLGIVVSSLIRFLDAPTWAKNVGPEIDPYQLLGRPCYGGIDLSATTDLTSFVLLFPMDGYFYVHTNVFSPADTAVVRERQQDTPYRAWAQAGHLTLTPGNVVDYSAVEDRVLEAKRNYKLKKVFVDPWNATHLSQNLAAKGVEIEDLPQTIAHLSTPTKELLRLAKTGQLAHGGHPVLAWAASNAVADMDHNENIRLSKKKSKDRIDPLAALVNAIAAYLADTAGVKQSVYATRGVRTI